VKYLKNEKIEPVHQQFVNFKKAYDSVREAILYNNLIEVYISIKLVRIIQIFLPKSYSRGWVGKNLSGMFPYRIGLKQGDALTSFFLNFMLEKAIRSFRQSRMA
jgi:hypothetical protein